MTPHLQTIIDRRKALGMTQADLARATGILPGDINHYESGRKPVGLNVLNRLASAVGLEVRLCPLTEKRD